MDHLLGLVGKDYVLLVADRKVSHSVLSLKNDHDKIMHLDDSKLFAIAGEGGDAVQFSEYVQKNLHLYSLRTGLPLSTKAAAHFTRNELATALRKGPFQVNSLLGGVDKSGPSLYHLDYLGTLCKLNYGAQGYGGYFCYSIFDRMWKPDMTLDEGLAVMNQCIKEINNRFLVGGANFTVKIVTANGIQVLDTVSAN